MPLACKGAQTKGSECTKACWPVLDLQDDIYQPWEDQLPYLEFSVRLPRSSIADIVLLLSAIQDEDYRQLRSAMAKYWRAFVWDRSAGGQAVS